jgi:Ran GTPase-activating protein (RanGAP) involved in mRNA processing and transport
MLHLPHCGLGSSPEILLVILQSDVKCIYLNNNNIDSLGAAKIAEYLEGNPPVQRIDLEKNRLNDYDVILISQALKRNTNLSHLDLQGNNFTSIGVKALLNCVFDSSSLNAISESNHTLLSMFIFSRRSNIRLHWCINRMLDLDRTQKIFLALQDKDSLLKYLANIPVELIPDVLTFPQRVDDQPLNKHLNIFFSTMRWWNMPLLYSYYKCVKSDTKRKREMTV